MSNPCKEIPNPIIDEEKQWLFAETGRLHLSLTKANKEIERLKSLMPPDDTSFLGKAWSLIAEKLRLERNALSEILAGLREKGIIDQHNRPLPLEGHHKDCGHGKDGWSMCTCDKLRIKVEQDIKNKQFSELVEEGQNLRKEFDHQTAGMRGPPQCSKCGDTRMVQIAPNARGVKQCDCVKGRPSPLAESLIKAFQTAAADAVRTTLARGGTTVGEVQGQWRVVSKTCEHGNTECKKCETRTIDEMTVEIEKKE